MNLDYLLRTKSNAMESAGTKGYYYASTRARAMASKLLTELDYEKLMKMDINELIRFLGEGEYKKEIDAVGIKATKIELLEVVLNENLANSVNGLMRFMPPDCPLWTYIMKYDIANIKTIIRSKESKGKKEALLRSLIYVGSFKKAFLQSLAGLDSKAAVIEALKGTPYFKVLKKYEGKGSEYLEDELENFYFRTMLKISERHRNFLSFIKTEIDIRNVLILFRLKRAKVHDFEKFLINGGSISAKKLRDLARMDEFEIINNLKNYKLWKFAPTNTKELDKIEVGLRKFLFFYALHLQRAFNSFETLLGYLIGKEREIINIRILALSKIAKHAEDALSIRSKLYAK